MVDQFAAAFGRENVRVLYANENGHALGKPLPEGNGVKLSETLVGPWSAQKERR